MTPNDIQNKPFSRGMNGYKPDEVTQYLKEVADYVRQLQKQNAELMEKMEVLAEKVEEYRSDEDSLRAALIGAQKLGDSVVREAKKKAQSIREEAERQADAVIGEARRSIEVESYTLSQKQHEAAKFKKQILSMYEQQIELIKATPFDLEKLAPMPSYPEAMRARASAQRKEKEADKEAEKESFVIDFGDAVEGVENIELDYDEMEEEEAEPLEKAKFGGNLQSFFGEGNEPKRYD